MFEPPAGETITGCSNLMAGIYVFDRVTFTDKTPDHVWRVDTFEVVAPTG